MKKVKIEIKIDDKHTLNALYDASQLSIEKMLELIYFQVSEFIKESKEIEDREQEMST